MQTGLGARGEDPASGDRLFREGAQPKMIYPLVRELAVDGIPVTVTCRLLKFSPQGYYKWLKAPVTRRDLENAYLTNQLLDATTTTRLPTTDFWLTSSNDVTSELQNVGCGVCARRWPSGRAS